MRTLVVSDLHLGAVTAVDLVRRPELREPLIAALRDVDRLVILGDGLELREVPVREAAGYAVPLLREAGAALGPDGEIVLLPGNHDHALVSGWLEAHLGQAPPRSMGLANRIAPEEASPLARDLAAAAAPAKVSLAYPGIWLRDDVFGIHGHYLDVHTTVPTFERLAAGAMARWMAPLPAEHARPDDYEAVVAPLYAWMFAHAQHSDDGQVRKGARGSARAYVVMAGEGRRRHPVRAALLGTAFAAAVTGLNLTGVGPVRPQLSGAALRRGSLTGIGEVLRRLDVRAPHVIFGHSHRSGPWSRDDPAEWTAPQGSRLYNTGSWVYQPHFLDDTPNASPYWPGSAVLVEDDGPPRLVRLLGDRGHAELRPPGSAPLRAARA